MSGTAATRYDPALPQLMGKTKSYSSLTKKFSEGMWNYKG